MSGPEHKVYIVYFIVRLFRKKVQSEQRVQCRNTFRLKGIVIAYRMIEDQTERSTSGQSGIYRYRAITTHPPSSTCSSSDRNPILVEYSTGIISASLGRLALCLLIPMATDPP